MSGTYQTPAARAAQAAREGNSAYSNPVPAPSKPLPEPEETILVTQSPYTGEEIAAEFIQHICCEAEGGGGVAVAATCKACIGESRYRDFMLTILPLLLRSFEAGDASIKATPIGWGGAANVVENDFFLFFTFLANLSADEETEVVGRICEEISSEHSAPSTRLGVLMHLYSIVRKDSNNRCRVFTSTAKLARDVNQAEFIRISAADLFSLLQDWKASKAQMQEAFICVSEVCDKAGRSSESQEALLYYIRHTLNDASPEELKAATPICVRALVNAIRASISAENFTLLNPAIFRAIAQLRDGHDENGRAAHRLLSIMATELIPAFSSFCEENPDFFEKNGVCKDSSWEKMRLLAFSSLASSSSDAVRYADIARELQIEESEVEKWVVRAIKAKIVDAKMDQIQRTVEIHRCVPRMAMNDLPQLSKKLLNWRNSVQQLSESLGSAK